MRIFSLSTGGGGAGEGPESGKGQTLRPGSSRRREKDSFTWIRRRSPKIRSPCSRRNRYPTIRKLDPIPEELPPERPLPEELPFPRFSLRIREKGEAKEWGETLKGFVPSRPKKFVGLCTWEGTVTCIAGARPVIRGKTAKLNRSLSLAVEQN